MAEIIYPPTAVDEVLKALIKYGITNPNMQAAILGTIAKETGFILRPEIGYSKTSNERIRSIFSWTRSYTDADLNKLKADDVAFFNKMYGGKYGNSPTEGYKYRGRGFNGITFKSNYQRYGKLIGRDLVNNPDLLNNIEPASEAVAAYFKDSFEIGKKSGDLKKKIGVNDVSEIKDLNTAVKAAVQANAGWKTDLSGSFLQENLKKALFAANALIGSLEKIVKENPGKSALAFFLSQRQQQS